MYDRYFMNRFQLVIKSAERVPLCILLRMSSWLYSSSSGSMWVNWSSSSTRSRPSGITGWSLKPSFLMANITSIMYWTLLSMADSWRTFLRRSNMAEKRDQRICGCWYLRSICEVFLIFLKKSNVSRLEIFCWHFYLLEVIRWLQGTQSSSGCIVFVMKHVC